MKKAMLAVLILLGFSLQAQPEPNKDGKRVTERMESLTPQQRTELKTKKMTLHLDLTDEQQKKVSALILKQEEERNNIRSKRKKKENLSDEELFAMKSEQLDKQIEMKKEMQEILTEEQFVKFEKMHQQRHGKRKRLKARKGI